MPSVQPPWKGHAGFGLVAFDSLHPWQREMVQPDLSPAALDKPYFPKGELRSAREKMGFMCVSMDLVYYDDMRPYVTLSDGRWIPHAPPDERTQATTSTGAPASPLVGVELIHMLLQRTVEAIRAGDWEEMIRHAGTLGHFIQEPFTPGHAINNDLFHELFPDPDPGRHMRLHHAFDSGTTDFEPLPPTLMGRTLEEAAFRMQLEIERGVREGKKLVGPVIRSVYEGQPDKVREAILAGQSQQAAWMTASAWHTAFCIALDRFDEQEGAALDALDLTRCVPYFCHHWQYVELTPGHLVKQKRKIPIDVWVSGDDGKPIEQRIDTGFGMGGHMGFKFFVHGDLYPTFRCRVGLPSRHTEGQGAHTDTRFFVEIDREVNRTYSEEMEYDADRRLSIPLEPGAPVQEVAVDIRGARSLLLTTQSRPYADPETGRMKFMIPHVAVCEPRLTTEIPDG
ncbi:MAG: hypothetical protein ACODAQ_10945 [Phycisphaeraceae bacterium]